MSLINATLQIVAAAATLLTISVSQAQQSLQSPQPVPAVPAQVQPARCGTTSAPSKSSVDLSKIKVPNKWQVLLQKQAQRAEAATGMSIGDMAADAELATAAPAAPCPPSAAPQKPSQPIQSSALKLPPDTTVTLHCTPIPPGGNGHTTTLILPDPGNFAVAKPSDFLADSVTPDLSAHTPCFLIRTDPDTKKVFVLAK